LKQLDLSKNKLRGGIPQEFSKLTKLASLDVSSNRLCGPLPEGRQLDTFSSTSFENNECLCGNPLQACKEKERQVGPAEGTSISKGQKWLKNVDEHVSLIALGLEAGIGFGGVVSVMTMWNKTRN